MYLRARFENKASSWLFLLNRTHLLLSLQFFFSKMFKFLLLMVIATFGLKEGLTYWISLFQIFILLKINSNLLNIVLSECCPGDHAIFNPSGGCGDTSCLQYHEGPPKMCLNSIRPMCQCDDGYVSNSCDGYRCIPPSECPSLEEVKECQAKYARPPLSPDCNNLNTL